YHRAVSVLMLWLLAIPAHGLKQPKPGPPEARGQAGTAGTSSEPKSQAANKDPNSYIIAPNDVLDIRVFKEPDLSLNSVKLRPDGKVSVPLLNDLQAEGLTPVQLGASIAVLLRKYLTDPKVTVIVTQNAGQRVYVVGEVVHQGPISLLPGMTVVQALAMAGGF